MLFTNYQLIFTEQKITKGLLTSILISRFL